MGGVGGWVSTAIGGEVRTATASHVLLGDKGVGEGGEEGKEEEGGGAMHAVEACLLALGGCGWRRRKEEEGRLLEDEWAEGEKEGVGGVRKGWGKEAFWMEEKARGAVQGVWQCLGQWRTVGAKRAWEEEEKGWREE